MPDGFGKKVKREFNRVVKEIYGGKLVAGDIDTKLYKVIGQALEGAITDGFGSDFTTVDWNTPDGEMLSRLTRDVWQFSAAKNYNQMRDMTKALIDDKGNLRTLADFKEVAQGIDKTYNQTWLTTEYHQAVGTATMASRWSEFQQNADIMPMLQYDTVGDNNVRDEHALLDGVTRNIEDDFWAQHYPPNGWGCRCSVNQLASSMARETNKDAIPKIKIPTMFKTNLADTGLVFPKGHAYYDGVPDKVLREAVASLPDNIAYTKAYENWETKGTVQVHKHHGTGETAANVIMSESLADAGYKVKLLPIIDKNRDDLRKLVYKTIDFKVGKNPDALINGEIFEMKWVRSVNYKRIQKDIYEASKQASSIYLNIVDAPTGFNINQPVNGILNQSKSIKQVWIDYDGELIKWQNPNY